MDEHKSPKTTPLLELIEQVLAGNASDEQMRQLDARLLASAEDRKFYLHRLNLHSALRRRFAHDTEEEPATPLEPAGGEQGVAGTQSRAPARRTRWPWAVAAAAVVLLIATVYLQQPTAERPIAKITGLSGSLQWTGDGGRVLDELKVGTELPGGTVEGMTPGSWFELEFNDGSTVALSGNATLTFSDRGQKALHLKDGNLSGNVKPQPAGKPMLIYTRSAMLEVLGTDFEVEAELAATTLNVSKGTVRVKRFSDGSTVDVPAKHRVIAAADREMRPLPVPESVGSWQSQLHLGPGGAQGKWSLRTGAREAKLEAVPYTTPRGATIYTAGFGVSYGDRPPVILQGDSRLRVRGRIASPHPVYFGVTVQHAGGEFAGRFQTIRPTAEFSAGQEFEVALELRDFRLDPSLNEMKDKLSNVPFGLIVDSIWCHTLNTQAGLEIIEVELIPPTEDGSP